MSLSEVGRYRAAGEIHRSAKQLAARGLNHVQQSRTEQTGAAGNHVPCEFERQSIGEIKRSR